MNRNTTIALVVVFALLGLYVLLVQRPKDQQAEATPTAPAASPNLWTAASDQVKGLRLEDRAGGRAVAFSQDAQGAWSVTEPESRPADAAKASDAVTSATGLYVSATITESVNLADYGLAQAAYWLKLDLADGTALQAGIGDKAPTGNGYFVQRSGETDVLVVSTFSVEKLIGLLDTPPYLEPTATPEPGPTPPFAIPTLAP